MSLVVTEGEVASVEVDEEVREDKEQHQRHRRQDDNQEKVRLLGRKLLDFHPE